MTESALRETLARLREILDRMRSERPRMNSRDAGYVVAADAVDSWAEEIEEELGLLAAGSPPPQKEDSQVSDACLKAGITPPVGWVEPPSAQTEAAKVAESRETGECASESSSTGEVAAFPVPTPPFGLEADEAEGLRRFLAGEPFQSSTGIHEGLTCGYGDLDGNGFWQFPLPNALVALIEKHMEQFKTAALQTAEPRHLEQFAREILKRFKESEANGAHTRDREYAISMLEKALELVYR